MKKFTLLLLLILSLTCTAQAQAPLNLVWQHDNSPAVDLSQLPAPVGVNVVSPCWYDIATPYGELKNKSVSGYVAAAQAKGYQVWPLITSSFDPDLFHQVLSDYHARRYVIEQLLAEAQQHGFDGVNLDFENIRDADRDLLTLFVGELVEALHKQALVVSMDITVPSNQPYWSNCYDRPALGRLLDYVMLMAYDQYTPAMRVVGPTAALDWVETKLQATLKSIPPSKLLLGLPLYTRLWTTDLATGEVSGRTLSMPQAQELLTSTCNYPGWRFDYQEKQGLYKCSYPDEGKLYTFYLEDQFSLQRKQKLVARYQLAGIASWRKGFETPEVWPALAR